MSCSREPECPLPIWTQPHIEDGEGGWYVVINQHVVAGPFDEETAARKLREIAND